MALREQNYEEYLRLARTTKDKRLRTLLDKTDAIISDLGLKVPRSLSKALLFSSQGGDVRGRLGSGLAHRHL